jgi:ribosomal-protein-alanine N-acetyltransferase
MNEIVIAKNEHLPLIAELEKATFFEPWSEKALELFIADENFCVCATDENVLAAYCTVTVVLDEAQIINVATAESFKRQGYAEKVLLSVIEECKKRSICIISLEVRESNEPAINLYGKLGFTIEGKRKDFYRNPRENALVMIKKLD